MIRFFLPMIGFMLGILSDVSAQGSGITGYVRDAADNPVGNAWIEVRRAAKGVLDPAIYDGEPFAKTRSLPDGAYVLRGLGAGTWLFTISSGDSRGDAEMVEFVRELAKGGNLPSVPMARLLHRFATDEKMMYQKNIVIDSTEGSKPYVFDSTHFRPDEFGYQITISPLRPSRSAPGSGSVTFTSDDWDPNSAPGDYYAVPTADGRFDVGGARVGEYDIVRVEVFTLMPNQPVVTGRVFLGRIADLATDGSTSPMKVPSHCVISLNTETAKSDSVDGIDFSVWGEHSIYPQDSRYADWQEGEVALILPKGAYAVRALQGDLASPLTLMSVDPEAGSVSVTLAMEACPPYSMRVIDQDGQPLHQYKITLRIGGGPGPMLYCLDGKVRVEGILPGEYEAQIQYEFRTPILQRIRLGPGELLEVNVPR